jgi:hypothetical protein
MRSKQKKVSAKQSYQAIYTPSPTEKSEMTRCCTISN